MQRAPTIHDLRVKSCYICCEEEDSDQPRNINEPPKRWVHPCKCTLIAHEQCLLEWIKSAENNPDKSASSILKCPQCKVQYRMKSNYPLPLRVMDVFAAAIRLTDHFGTVFTLVSGAASVSAGAYITLTACGAYAVRQFVGPEMFRLILGNDVEIWPLRAFFNLPLIPLSLILGRTKRFRYKLPLFPLMMIWPSVAKFRDRSGRPLGTFLGQFGSFGPNNPVPRWLVPQKFRSAYPSTVIADTFQDTLYSWPPSPFIFQFGLAAVRLRYNEYMTRFRRYILGNEASSRDLVIDRGFLPFNFQVEMEVVDDDDDDEADRSENGDAPNDGGVDDNNNVRLVLEENVEVHHEIPLQNNRVEELHDGEAFEIRPFAIDEPNVWEDEDFDDAPLRDHYGNPPAEQGEAAENAEPDQDAAPVANNDIGNENADANQAANQNQNGNPPNNNGDGDPLRVQLTGRVIGRLVGGALVIPMVANIAGSILLKLALPPIANAHERLDFTGYSFFSPRRLLCMFLGVRPPDSARKFAASRQYAFHNDMGAWQIMISIASLATRTLLVGTPAWSDSDPVWWRNTVGLGLCYVAKDLVSIWYCYLSQREVKSRHLLNRPFTGVDPTELDLKPEVRERYLQEDQ